jgi:hypothetical protein
MKLNLAVAAAATAVLSITSNAYDAEELIKKEKDLMTSLNSLHIVASVSAPTAPSSNSSSGGNITIAFKDDYTENEKERNGVADQMVTAVVETDEQPLATEEVATRDASPDDDVADVAATPEQVNEHKKTKREKHHEDRIKATKAAKNQKTEDIIVSQSDESTMSLPASAAEDSTDSDSGGGGGMSASTKATKVKPDKSMSTTVAKPKASKVKPTKEDETTTTSSQSMPTHAKTTKMSVASDAMSTTMGAKAAKPTHAKTHKMSVASDAMSTTMDSKAAKMMKRNNDGGGREHNKTMTETYATEPIKMIVYTEKPETNAEEAQKPSSGSAPRVPDEASSERFSNDVKEMFAEEVKEVMIQGTVAETSSHVNSHSGEVDLEDKPRMSTSALEAANGVASSYASHGTVVVVGLCLVASSLAFAMA